MSKKKRTVGEALPRMGSDGEEYRAIPAAELEAHRATAMDTVCEVCAALEFLGQDDIPEAQNCLTTAGSKIDLLQEALDGYRVKREEPRKSPQKGTKGTKKEKEAIEGAIAEIMAGMVLVPLMPEEKAFNSGSKRAVDILQQYQRGEGLFQMVVNNKPKEAK